MKCIMVACLCLTLSACSSVTIRTDAQNRSTADPSFQKRYSYWWWGLRGEHDINVRAVCSGKPVEQMQSVVRLSDAAYTLLTIGIYAPRTARVWCEDLSDE